MLSLDASAVAKLLRELGQRAALHGDNPYRARAYLRAAESLLAVPEPLENLVAQKRLQEVPGIGKAIAEIVAKLHREGSHPVLEALRQEAPAGVLEMLDVPGLRPDKALKIYKELGINSLDELETAARQGRLAVVRGLGAALQAKILQGIEIRRKHGNRHHLHRAAALLEQAETRLHRFRQVKRVTPAGDVRRGCELCSTLSLVAEVGRRKGGPDKLGSESQLAVHFTDKRHYGISLLLATGSEEHLHQLRGLAASRGLTLDEQGVHTDGSVVASRTEEEIYEALGLPFIAPELREGRGEIELAHAGKLPNLVADPDLQGVLHAHTNRSDGADTLETMAEAVRGLGYAYFGVADHSRSAHYARGLSTEQVAEQHAEIDALNRRFGDRFQIFKGIESDILADGSLDYPDDVLSHFDFVIASVHSRFKLSRREQTERIIRAVQNPRTTILGHMTGRQLLRRPGYEIDIEEVLRACAAHGVAVEINANPWRLDLDWRWHQRALELGCTMSINPDAHDTGEIALTHWGVVVARKGGVPKERVLNCLDRTGFAASLEAKRRSPARTRVQSSGA